MTRRTQGRHRATDCISQVCPGNGETCRMRFDSPMTQARRIQARNRVTDCVFQGSTRIPEVTEPEALDLEVYCWMPEGEQQSASSSFGHNEFHNPYAQASGVQSKEDENVTNMLATGVKLFSNLVTRVEEILKITV